MIGLFGRFGWNNDDVYVVQWEHRVGQHQGAHPRRDEDTIGLGFAALTRGTAMRKTTRSTIWNFTTASR